MLERERGLSRREPLTMEGERERERERTREWKGVEDELPVVVRLGGSRASRG